jgi:hypothetical protein
LSVGHGTTKSQQGDIKIGSFRREKFFETDDFMDRMTGSGYVRRLEFYIQIQVAG